MFTFRRGRASWRISCCRGSSRSVRSRSLSVRAGTAEARPCTSGASVPLSDPDRVVTRLDSFISAYGARATLFELWNRNPAIFELLVLLV